MSSGFDKVVSGVEVFEVGFNQTRELLKDWRVTCTVTLGGYVVVGAMSAFRSPVNGVYAFNGDDTLIKTVDYVQYSDGVNLKYLQEAERKFGVSHEVWHIVDDAELWQAWEYASACACKEGGQATNYHLYEDGKCILDFVNEVPQVLYSLRCVDSSYNPICAKYYADPLTWSSMVSYYQQRYGLNMLTLDVVPANMAGLHIIDDWQRDEGQADGIKLLVIYLWG